MTKLSINVIPATAIFLFSITTAPASEIKLLAGGAMTSVWAEIQPKFEQASGHKLVVRFGTTPELIKLATSGGPFDLGVVPREVFKDPDALAKFTGSPPTDIATVGLGVAVRSGASKPDISTPDTFKQTLLNAQSIATIPASAAGAQVLRTFDRLGVGDAVKGKIKPQVSPADVVRAVASGDAELGVFLINVLVAPGLDLVGAFPTDVQQNVVFTAALAKDAKEPAAANALITYLKTPEAAAIIKAKGMRPWSEERPLEHSYSTEMAVESN